jgi:NADP-dependent 3-hydroxy acid dehydrogenase YdfG
MNTKQVVTVVGASERIGSAMATAISKGNYRVLLQSENFEKVQCIVNEIRRDSPGSDVEAVPYAIGRLTLLSWRFPMQSRERWRKRSVKW